MEGFGFLFNVLMLSFVVNLCLSFFNICEFVDYNVGFVDTKLFVIARCFTRFSLDDKNIKSTEKLLVYV